MAVGDGTEDVVDMGRQTRGTNKREEDNEAKQWGHRSWEMDGRGERQRQKTGRGRRRGEKRKRQRGKEKECRRKDEYGKRKAERKCGIKSLRKRGK